jgi:hypothetical protein
MLLFFLFFFQDYPYCILFLQLEIEVFKLFNVTILKFSLVMRKVLDMISLLIYIVVEVGSMGNLLFPGVQT